MQCMRIKWAEIKWNRRAITEMQSNEELGSVSLVHLSLNLYPFSPPLWVYSLFTLTYTVKLFLGLQWRWVLVFCTQRARDRKITVLP